MSEIITKYNLLDKSAKSEVLDFVDFLLSKKRRKNKSHSSYKKKISAVSTWSEEDLKIFDKIENFLINGK